MNEMFKVVTIEYKDKSSFIYLDNNEIIEIPMAVFFDFNLSVNQMISLDVYHSLFDAKKNFKIKEFINLILTKRDVSSYELASAIYQKFGLSLEEIKDTLSIYLSKGLLDDERFLKEKIASLLTRNYGYIKVLAYLEEKGFSKEEISNAFSEDFKQLESHQALQVAQKYVKVKKKSKEKLMHSLYQRLAYCGYGEALVYETLKKMGLNPDFTQ